MGTDDPRRDALHAIVVLFENFVAFDEPHFELIAPARAYVASLERVVEAARAWGQINGLRGGDVEYALLAAVREHGELN